MTKLTFGMSFHETYRYSRQAIIDYARAIESLGFDTLWITENVHSGADALEPLATLSFMAAHTEQINFRPLRHPPSPAKRRRPGPRRRHLGPLVWGSAGPWHRDWW